MDFSDALRALNQGKRLTRTGWNGRGMFIFLASSAMAIPHTPWPTGQIVYEPHIDLRTVSGQFIPWLASQTDILAKDWELVSDGAK